MKKKVWILALAAVLVMGLYGCGKKAKTAQEVLTETGKNVETIENVAFRLQMDLYIRELILPSQIIMEGTLAGDPVLLHANMDVNMGIMGKNKMELYSSQEWGKTVTWTKTAIEGIDADWADPAKAKWKKREVPDKSNVILDSLKLVEKLKDVKMAQETETVNGLETVRLDGTVSGQELLELVNSLACTIGSGDISEDANQVEKQKMDALLEKRIPVTYLIDPETMLPAACTVDCTELIETIGKPSDPGTRMTSLAKFTYVGYNTIQHIEIPQEVLDAQ